MSSIFKTFLCLLGLLILTEVHSIQPLQNGGIQDYTNTGDVTYTYSYLDDVMERLHVTTDVRLLPDIEYIIGDMNLVLAAPHGGYKRPQYIPDRTTGCFLDGKCVFRNECEPKDYERYFLLSFYLDTILFLWQHHLEDSIVC